MRNEDAYIITINTTNCIIFRKFSFMQHFSHNGGTKRMNYFKILTQYYKWYDREGYKFTISFNNI